MLHNAWSCQTPQTQYGVMESQPVSTMEHVYSGRTLLPMKTTNLHVPILNTRSREVTLQRGTLLGKVFAANSVVAPTATRSHVNHIRAGSDISTAHKEVIEKMVDGLPPELTSKQREKVRKLLTQYRTTFYRRPRCWANAFGGTHDRHGRPQAYTATVAQTAVPAPNLHRRRNKPDVGVWNHRACS